MAGGDEIPVKVAPVNLHAEQKNFLLIMSQFDGKVKPKFLKIYIFITTGRDPEFDIAIRMLPF